MKVLFALLTASVMLTAISCNEKIDTRTNASDGESFEMGTTDQKLEEEVPQEKNKKTDQQVPTTNTGSAWDKKIIKTAVLSAEVTDFRKYNDEVHGLAEKWEGYIAKEEENSSDENIRNALVIKVPVERFDEAVNSISSLDGKLLMKQISTEDVSSEVFDTKMRMEAKRKIRVRYLEMLQKTKNMDEMMQVEREINQIQEQIEAAEGRVNYLMHKSSFSTIELTFFQVLKPGSTTPETTGYAKRLTTALSDGLEWIGNTVIFFAAFWPIWLFLILLFVVVKRVRLVSVKTKN